MPYWVRCSATMLAMLLTLLTARGVWAEDKDQDERIFTVPGTSNTLGAYEQAAMRHALAKKQLTLEEEPEGKRIGRIVVVNLDVFGKAEGILRVLNVLHVTTREHVIDREVLLRPGDLWNSDILAETQRRLKDPLFTTLVAVVPVKAQEEGIVDLLVVTRDIWSLRMNSAFEYQQGILTGLQLAIAENNIFGLRKHGAFVFDMNQGNYTLGPQYVDKALGGTRLRLTTRVSAIFAREDSDFEGTSSGTSLSYPLWSLRQTWGGDVSMTHANYISRSFTGTDIETVDLTTTPEEETLPRVFAVRSLRLTSRVRRAFGKGVKQIVSLGHSLSSLRPNFVDGFDATEAEREAFADQVFPRSERLSSLFARYELFTPNFVMYRNLNSFDLAEDVRLGPSVSAGVSVALRALGSEAAFYQPDVTLAWVFDIAGDGFAKVSTQASSRIENSEFTDNFSLSAVKVATPRIGNVLRIVGQAELGVRLRERGNARFRLGGESGLRGYAISQYTGQKRVRTNLEVRSMPMRILFARAGALAFWDMGHAADRLGQLEMKHSAGFGLRALVPQLQPIVFRLDVAFPLSDLPPGFPARISAGVAQVF